MIEGAKKVPIQATKWRLYANVQPFFGFQNSWSNWCRPLPTFATLLTYEISKFIMYMSLSIPGYSSLHPGPFKWIWIPTFAIISFHPSPCTTPTKDPGGTPYNYLYGEAPPERGIFSRLQVYETVGISLVEVYKRGGKSVIWVCERTPNGVTDEF